MGITNVDILKSDVTTERVYEEVVDEHNEMLTHVINPPSNTHIWEPGMSAQDVVDYARAQGWWVIALCGKKWVPKRNPDKYPACKTCMDIAANLIGGS